MYLCPPPTLKKVPTPMLVVIICMIHDFLSFYIVVSKCEEWKEKAFLWSAPGDSYHLYIRHCSRACGGILPCWFKV